jgi:Flp pilus assembly protein TadD
MGNHSLGRAAPGAINQSLGLTVYYGVSGFANAFASPSAMRISRPFSRYLGSAATAAILAVALGGCQTIAQSPDVTGSLNARAEAESSSRDLEVYGERYRANPKNAEAALQYGQALRLNGQRQQAVAVLEQATIVNPGEKPLLAAYGRALADNGNFQQAFDILSRAHTPSNPDWRVLSVQGTVLDQMGKHEEARRYYASALKIVPEEPSVLSNLGLSYVLSKDLPKAESTLRMALDRGTSDVRVRQNLGLAIGLQGRFAEAETIVKADLPPDQAEANVAYLKQMLHRGEVSPSGPRTSSVTGPSRS